MRRQGGCLAAGGGVGWGVHPAHDPLNADALSASWLPVDLPRFGRLRQVWVARKPPGFGEQSRRVGPRSPASAQLASTLASMGYDDLTRWHACTACSLAAFLEMEDDRDANDAVRKLDGASASPVGCLPVWSPPARSLVLQPPPSARAHTAHLTPPPLLCSCVIPCPPTGHQGWRVEFAKRADRGGPGGPPGGGRGMGGPGGRELR